MVTGNLRWRRFSLTLAVLAALCARAGAEDTMMTGAAMTGGGDAMMSGAPAMMSSGGGDQMMSGGDAMMSGGDAMMSGPAMAPAEGAKPEEAPKQAEAKPAEPAPPIEEPPRLAFIMETTRLPLGELRMIPVVRTGGKLGEKLVSEVKVEGGNVEILRQPEFLPGQEMGFMRVRAAKEGKAKLALGDQHLEIEVSGKSSPTRERLERPVITAPANGSAVKGDFAVGMEAFSDEIENLGGKDWVMRLRLPDGKLLEPVEELGVVDGPVRRAFFTVNAEALPDGRVELTPVMVNAAAGREIPGDRVTVRPLAADAVVVAAGECEDIDESWERPKDWKELPGVAADVRASGQRFVRMPGGRPYWGFPADFPEEGQYQLFMRVRGELAGGAYPTVAVRLENGGDRKATTRMVSGSWHRLPIGPPFRVKKGQNAVAAEFTNDFGFGNRLARDAYYDTYELVKVKFREPASERPLAKGEEAPVPTPEQVAAAQAVPTFLEPTGNDAPMRITFRDPVDGRPVRGLTEIKGAVWRNNRSDNQKENEKRAAEVTLFLNGQPAGKQKSDEPKFEVPAHRFVKGRNEVRLWARAGNGRQAWSETAVVYRNAGPEKLEKPAEIEKPYVWTCREGQNWKMLEAGFEPAEGDILKMFSAGTTEISIPNEIRGKVDLVVKLRGDVFNGEPESEVKVGDKLLAVWKPGAEWTEFKLEQVDLPEKDDRKLAIRFTNDAAESAEKDRNLIVGAVKIVDRTLEPDKSAPIVKVLYPKPGQEVSQADALVMEVFDDRKLGGLDVRVDGKSLEYWMEPDLRPGLVVLPLGLRQFQPGEHKIQVIQRDKAENEGKSEEVSVKLAADNSVAARMHRPYDRAVRLLRRFAFGPEPLQLAEVLTKGEEAWLKARLTPETGTSASKYRALQYSYIRLNKVDDYQVRNRALLYAMYTDNPVQARFNFWIQNHFCTWQNKTGNQEKWDEYLGFQRLGTAPFFDLLYSSATSSAMMIFLDQKDSFAGKINENYAREIMELHTVGVKGGYTQEDVTQLAGMLTGWSSQKEGVTASGTGEGSNFFRYSPYLNDGKARDIYGLSLPAAKVEQRFDRVRQYLEMLASRPETARYYTSKLAAHYYGRNAPAELVDELAKIYLASGGDTSEILMAIYKSPEFWSDDLPDKIAQPLDYGIGLERMMGAENHDSLDKMMQKAGRALFDRSTPDGYPEEDDEYADSNYMLQKWVFAKTLEWDLTNNIPWMYWQPEALKEEAGQKRLIDQIAMKVTGGFLGERSEAAALKVLQSDIPDPRQKLNQVAVLIAQLPETQVR